MSEFKGTQLIGEDGSIRANTTLPVTRTYTNYGAPFAAPVVTKIGTMRTDGSSAADTISETIDFGAADTSKKVYLVLAYGDGGENEGVVPAVQLDGVEMTLESITDGNTQTALLSADLPSGGSILMTMALTESGSWNSLSYQPYTVTGDHTLDIQHVDAEDEALLDGSSPVGVGSEVFGAVSLQSGTSVTLTGVTAGEVQNARAGRLYQYFGATSTDVETLTITAQPATGSLNYSTLLVVGINPIGAVSQAPTPQTDSFTVPEGSTGNTFDVLENDTDPQGNALIVTGATALLGSVTVRQDYQLTYDAPTQEGVGNFTDTITYTVEDTDGNSAQGQANVTVTDVNDLIFVAGKDGVITDPQGFDITSVDTAPSVGRVVSLRSDGKVSMDFTEETDAGLYSVTYTRDNGGPEQVTKSLELRPKFHLGEAPGQHYELEWDSNNRCIFEPGENTKTLYVKPNGSGLSLADIQAIEGGGFRVTDALTDLGTSGAAAGKRYGSEEGIAVDYDLYESMAQQFDNNLFASWEVLFEAGQTYGGASGSVVVYSQSALHPTKWGRFGTGANPRLAGRSIRPLGSSFVLMQDIAYGGGGILDQSTGSYFILDHLTADSQDVSGPTSHFQISGSNSRYAVEHATSRGCHLMDCHADAPVGALFSSGDRASGLKTASTGHLLLKDMVIQESGAGMQYRMDRDAAGEKSPEFYSHGGYVQGNGYDLTAERMLFMASGGSAVQFRCGVFGYGLVSAGCNGVLSQGPAPSDYRSISSDPVEVGASYGALGWYGAFGRVLCTQAGWRQTWDGADNTYVFGGIENQRENTALHKVFAVNQGGPIRLANAPTDFGPAARFDYNPDNGVPFAHKQSADFGQMGQLASNYPGHAVEITISNFNRVNFPDQNTRGATQAVRDAATFNGWADSIMSSTGEDYATFNDWLKTYSGEAYDLIPSLFDWMWAPYGLTYATGRTVGQTVQWHPMDGFTNYRGMILESYSTGDQPGTATGDTFDLDGHDRYMHEHTTQNKLVNVQGMANGSVYTVQRGALDTATISPPSGGMTFDVKPGAKFKMDAYTGSSAATFDAIMGRVHLRGANTGRMDFNMRYESELLIDAGGSLTLNGELKIYGGARVGFDGLSGASSLSFGATDTVSFKPTLVLPIENRVKPGNIKVSGFGGWNYYAKPVIGSTITGETSGATGVVRHVVPYSSQSAAYAMLDDLIGVFQPGENITGLRQLGSISIEDGLIGNVPSGTAITPSLGQIREFRSGINGYAAPDVDSTVHLDGTLHVDVAGMDAGTHVLIEANTLSGGFDTVSATGNSDKDLSLGQTGQSLTLTIIDGTGNVD